VVLGLASETHSDRRPRGDWGRHSGRLSEAEGLLDGLDLLYVVELAEKERVGLGGWMLHSAAEACLAVLLHVQQSSHREGSVVYQPQDLMEMWSKARLVRSLMQVVSLSVWLLAYSAKAMH
jgi:hypothetical protein